MVMVILLQIVYAWFYTAYSILEETGLLTQNIKIRLFLLDCFILFLLSK